MATKLEQTISFVELKNLARRMLPENSMLRKMILSEPDELPRDEAMVMLSRFVRRLHEEF